MALIKCPECEQSISDKASKCPKCGYPIQEYITQLANESETVNIEPVIDIPVIKKPKINIRQFSQNKKLSKKQIRVALIACIITVIAIVGIIMGVQISKSNLRVKNISISKWKLTDSSKYYDYYEGTITSEQKSPFIAVIGEYEAEDQAPRFVYVENGVGIFETSEDTDEDPSIKYRPLGYLSGQTIKESDITAKYSDSDYNDWSYSDSTSCDVLIDIKMNHTKNGWLVFDLINETNKETSRNLIAVVVNGKAEYNHYAYLPYKTRGIDVTIVPKIFCESKPITQEDYAIEKAYTAEKNEGSYSNSYSGEQTLAFEDYADGFVLFTRELKEGGAKENRNVVRHLYSFLHKGECTVTTYDSVKADETILMPKYDFNFIGYITWKPLDSEEEV